MALTLLLKKRKRILFPAICLILSGCGPYFIDLGAPTLTSTGQLIHAGLQATFDCEDEIFSIASGTNYYFAEFIDEFGNKREGMISGLYFSIMGKQERARYYSAYAGLIVYYYSLKIEILRIGIDRNVEFTEVKVNIVKPSSEIGSCFLT